MSLRLPRRSVAYAQPAYVPLERVAFLGSLLILAALAAYQRAVAIFPGWVNGYLALAETQEAVGNLAAAAQAYQQAVAFNLAWQGALADEAARLIAEEQWPAAIETYHRLMKD